MMILPKFIALTKRVLVIVLLLTLSICFGQQIDAQTQGAASLSLTPETISTRPEEQFTTQVWIDTDKAQVGGVDAKIMFNPKILSVVKVDTLPIFPDYPASTFDNSAGTINISGIVRSADDLYSGKAQFATITWKVNTSGETQIEFNYKPNATNDSNIAVLYGNGDILQKVNTVDVRAAALPNQSENSLAGTDFTPKTVAPQSTPIQPAITPFEIVLSIIVVLSVASQVYLYVKLRHIEQYKEGIPHIHTP